jgi:hypothetical protein
LPQELALDASQAAVAAALGLGLLGLVLAVVAGAMGARSRRLGVVATVATFAVAIAAPSVGILALMVERHAAEEDVKSPFLKPATAARERHDRYLASRFPAKVGFGCGLVVLAAGLVTSALRARGRRDKKRSGAVLATATLGGAAVAGALAATLGPLPPSKYTLDADDRNAWQLADAREVVDGDLEVGCDALDAALERYRTTEPDEWHWSDRQLLHSALLVDEDLHRELEAAREARRREPEPEPLRTDTADGPGVTMKVQVEDAPVLGPDAVVEQAMDRSEVIVRCWLRGSKPGSGTVRARLTPGVPHAMAADAGSTLAEAGVRACVLHELEHVFLPVILFASDLGATVVVTFTAHK